MKILAIGDVFGETGRKVIDKYLPQLKKEHEIDLVIANVENVTHGKGISYTHYQELKFTKEGKVLIDIMTSGNHIFHWEKTREFINQTPDLLRPLNSNPYPNYPGKGFFVKAVDLKIQKRKKICVINLIGTTFMPAAAENPYFALEKKLKELEQQDCDIYLVDFHAEATAEKIALALYFDGKISALWGTHTHVQTADERILSKGTGFITDLGMTGPYSGVIGAKPEVIFQRAKCGLPAKMRPHEDNGQFNGAIFEFDDVNNKLISIKRIRKIF
ncbi:TIGR00282 family metallophosphoesterase [endosymbiont GvMRE of Glomus versiforme]|uniref:TIGR00282 family metallophosphoesterase n=1 Tax=endosymbiont GvMRE of Glomus versiforme TaxID=2039283 RepID=UPI000EE0AB0B|nr:TIGR00282 family metallophosphoesterase [endosymbiont GvMRE of Glomus versiforme]RHZ35701.1 Metallophosphoesterase [endosymbiont GvMRE of Glomus versiforme]